MMSGATISHHVLEQPTVQQPTVEDEVSDTTYPLKPKVEEVLEVEQDLESKTIYPLEVVVEIKNSTVVPSCSCESMETEFCYKKDQNTKLQENVEKRRPQTVETIEYNFEEPKRKESPFERIRKVLTNFKRRVTRPFLKCLHPKTDNADTETDIIYV